MIRALKTCGEVDVYLHAFLTSAIDTSNSASRPVEDAPSIHLIGGWFCCLCQELHRVSSALPTELYRLLVG
jgi:hypothetical protein